jgi:hypothetical protein
VLSLKGDLMKSMKSCGHPQHFPNDKTWPPFKSLNEVHRHKCPQCRQEFVIESRAMSPELEKELIELDRYFFDNSQERSSP